MGIKMVKNFIKKEFFYEKIVNFKLHDFSTILSNFS